MYELETCIIETVINHCISIVEDLKNILQDLKDQITAGNAENLCSLNRLRRCQCIMSQVSLQFNKSQWCYITIHRR